MPRVSHAAFEPRPERDPIAILERQEADRLPDLLPLRHARMAESPFAYYRGTPAVMAFDLATTPRTDIIVQASGDAHISNFGLFASPERRLVFDANDFDETLPAAWEWDVKRLAASVVIAGRANGFSASVNRRVTMAAVRSYREWMARYAAMRLIEVWYSVITEEDIRAAAEPMLARMKDAAVRRARVESLFSKARGRDQLRAAANLTELRDGKRFFVEQPPVIQHIEIPGGPDAPAPGLRGLPSHDGREPPRVPGALPLHRLRAQGRGRRQCRDALLRDDPGGPRRERPAHPAGQGGDRVGARGALRGERLREPWRARRRRPAPHAGHA